MMPKKSTFNFSQKLRSFSQVLYEKLFRFVSKDAISFYPPLISTTSNVFPINARLHVIPHLATVIFFLFVIKQLYELVYKPFGFTPGGIEFQTLLLNAFII
jgi:hypothetical protein